ncbi:MAG: hypothetical protein L0196_01700 [candidate division Zixibacteria bacterium]|nr:hypothetical protein [candidate division Zixibacteria bacterium]
MFFYERLHKRWAAILSACLLSFSQALAVPSKRDPSRSHSSAISSSGVPITKQGTHRNNTFGLTVTNYGLLGNQGNLYLRDSFDSLLTVSFEFPLNSKIEYLFQGAFWVGGIVAGDTLVSTGTDGWLGLYEINPSSNPAEITAKKIGGGAQEIIFNYTDTLTDPAFVDGDPDDARLHRPLNFSFLQKSFVFRPAAGADSFAIIYLQMQNIGTNAIESLYFGLFMDADVGHFNTSSYFVDDLAGFVDSSLIPGTPLQGDIAFVWDNDGDPSAGSFRSTSATAVTGVKLIGSSQPVTKKSFNWWTPNGTVALDWGPQKAPGRLNQSGGRGQPEGDAMKYYYLSNGEIDYPQVRSVINQSSEGWLPPLSPQSAAIDIANGFDARYLFSYGSFDLPPGDTLVLVFAAAPGINLHISPANFANNLGFTSSNYLDSARINQYLRGLRFGSLIHNVLLAESLWNTGFQNLVLGPPVNVRFTEFDSSTLRLFFPQLSDLENGFNIYRSTDSNGTYVIVNATPVIDTIYDDSPLVENQNYWYKFSTVSISDIDGPLGGRIGPAIPGRPRAPTNLTDWSDKFGNIYLSWKHPLEGDLLRFRIYSAPIPGPFVFSLLDSVNTSDTVYVDPGFIAGQRFWYLVTAVDTFGLESSFSDTVRAMRFVFGNKALLVDRTSYIIMRFGSEVAARDSLLRFHSRLLRRFDFDMLNLSEDYYFGLNVDPAFVSRNPVIVAHSSELVTPIADNPSFLSLFVDYLKAGGKLIIDGHWAPVNVNSSFSLCDYSSFLLGITQPIWDTTRNVFGFDCLFFSPVYPIDSSLLANSFLFAAPNQPPYPVMFAESLKVNLFVRSIPSDRHYQYPTVPNINYLTNRYPLEDLYTFGSILGGSDPKHGQTVAKKHLDPATGGGFVWFNFPLYYMNEDSSKKAFRQALTDLGVQENFPKGI